MMRILKHEQKNRSTKNESFVEVCVCVCEAFHGLNGVLLCGILVTVTSDLSFNRLICRSINYHLIDYIRRCRVIFHSVKGRRYTSRERERHFNDSTIRKSIETEETERRVIKSTRALLLQYYTFAQQSLVHQPESVH